VQCPRSPPEHASTVYAGPMATKKIDDIQPKAVMSPTEQGRWGSLPPDEQLARLRLFSGAWIAARAISPWMRFGPGFAPAMQTPSYRLSTEAAADIWRSRRSLDEILRCGAPAFGARRADAQGDSDWKGVLQCLGLICEAKLVAATTTSSLRSLASKHVA